MIVNQAAARKRNSKQAHPLTAIGAVVHCSGFCDIIVYIAPRRVRRARKPSKAEKGRST
jgi:hypothetical protein